MRNHHHYRNKYLARYIRGQGIPGKRKFDFVTFVLGMYTYGPGLLIGWRYPKTIVLHPDYTMGWDEQDNPWVNPSSAWDE